MAPTYGAQACRIHLQVMLRELMPEHAKRCRKPYNPPPPPLAPPPRREKVEEKVVPHYRFPVCSGYCIHRASQHGAPKEKMSKKEKEKAKRQKAWQLAQQHARRHGMAAQ